MSGVPTGGPVRHQDRRHHVSAGIECPGDRVNSSEISNIGGSMRRCVKDALGDEGVEVALHSLRNTATAAQQAELEARLVGEVAEIGRAHV